MYGKADIFYHFMQMVNMTILHLGDGDTIYYIIYKDLFHTDKIIGRKAYYSKIQIYL